MVVKNILGGTDPKLEQARETARHGISNVELSTKTPVINY